MHDCTGFTVDLNEEAALIYTPKFREYGIQIFDGGSSFMVIRYCPWCGMELPTSLRDQWFDVIDQLGLASESEQLPAQYRSDAWWNTLDSQT
jgi:hypothetical protein